MGENTLAVPRTDSGAITRRPDSCGPEAVEITLLVPVHEEHENIVPFIREVTEMLKIPHQICIVYDSSSDSTLEKREEILEIAPSTRFVKNRFGKGIINAFKTGFDNARSNYVVPIMADLSDTPETINAMYEKIQEGFDLVVASRYAPGGKKIGGPFLKYLLSYFGNITLHWISGIPTHDMTNAFIMHKKEILDRINIRSNGGFEITMEIIAKSYILGCNIAEVPTVNRERSGGSSKFQLFGWISKYLYWYLYIVVFSLVNRLNAHYLADTEKKRDNRYSSPGEKGDSELPR